MGAEQMAPAFATGHYKTAFQRRPSRTSVQFGPFSQHPGKDDKDNGLWAAACRGITGKKKEKTLEDTVEETVKTVAPIVGGIAGGAVAATASAAAVAAFSAQPVLAA